MSIFGALLQRDILQQSQEIILECGHRHHISCLRSFLKKSQRIIMEQPVPFCPTCRGQIIAAITESLALDITADDIFSFFGNQLGTLLSNERCESLRTNLMPLLENPQNFELISSLTKEELQELIAKIKPLLKFLSLDSIRAGDFQSRLIESFPGYTKEQLHEALYAAIDYFSLKEEDINVIARHMAAQQGGGLMLQFAAPSLVAFKKLLRLPRPHAIEGHENPLITEAQKINRQALVACIIRLGLPHLLTAINEVCTSVEETPFSRLIASYVALQVLTHYFRRDGMTPYLRSLAKALFPLELDNLPQTANILASLLFSGDVMNRIPATLREIIAQNPQVQEHTRNALQLYVNHQQAEVDRIRTLIHPTRIRLDRGHIVLLGLLITCFLVNIHIQGIV